MKNKNSGQKEATEAENVVQREKVAIDWFAAYLKNTERDEQRAEAIREQLGHLKAIEKKVDNFFSEQVNTLSYCEYEGLLEEGDVRDKIAMRLIESQPGLKNESIKEVSSYIRKADKDLFLKLKDGVYTLDQLKARIAERKNGVKYVVLDDLRGVLSEKFF